MINICVFEDIGYKHLMPLTFMRPAYDLLVGTTTLFDKINAQFGYGNMTLHCRDFLKPIVQHTHPGIPINHVNTGAPCLFINGRTIMTELLADMIKSVDGTLNYLFVNHGQIVAIYVQQDLIQATIELITQLHSNDSIIKALRHQCVAQECSQAHIISYAWDLISHNATAMSSDFSLHPYPGTIKGHVSPFVSIINEKQVSIDQDVIIEDFVTLNAESGPIVIEKGAHIHSHSRIEGPVFIGKNSHIKGARVTQSSIGPYCKIGGEVSNSIFLGYSNKAHDGYIGHSYIGQWVNMGAMTTNSNLKNTYNTIKIQLPLFKEPVQTNEQFIGSMIGDHVKLGIGSLLNTGTVIGYGSSLYGSTIHSGAIDPFSWGESGHYVRHDLSAFLTAAQRMMSRRQLELRDPEKKVISLLAEMAPTIQSV